MRSAAVAGRLTPAVLSGLEWPDSVLSFRVSQPSKLERKAGATAKIESRQVVGVAHIVFNLAGSPNFRSTRRSVLGGEQSHDMSFAHLAQ